MVFDESLRPVSDHPELRSQEVVLGTLSTLILVRVFFEFFCRKKLGEPPTRMLYDPHTTEAPVELNLFLDIQPRRRTDDLDCVLRPRGCLRSVSDCITPVNLRLNGVSNIRDVPPPAHLEVEGLGLEN